MSEQLDLGLPAPDPFTEFWAAYPRRKDRLRAEANFRRALKVDSAASIIEGAKRYAAAVAGWDASAVQLPDSWLSRERWRVYVPQLEQAPQAERWERGAFYVPPEVPSGWESE